MKYSADQDTWHDELCDVLYELEEAGELAVGARYYKGAAVVPKLSYFFNVDQFLDRLDEALCDAYGDVNDDLSLWNDLDPEAVKSLDAFVKTWLDENCILPIFFSKKHRRVFGN